MKLVNVIHDDSSLFVLERRRSASAGVHSLSAAISLSVALLHAPCSPTSFAFLCPPSS